MLLCYTTLSLQGDISYSSLCLFSINKKKVVLGCSGVKASLLTVFMVCVYLHVVHQS